jgi:cell division initiation protein
VLPVEVIVFLDNVLNIYIWIVIAAAIPWISQNLYNPIVAAAPLTEPVLAPLAVPAALEDVRPISPMIAILLIQWAVNPCCGRSWARRNEETTVRSTPMDIRQQQFTVKMFRGFDTQEVDTFLEDLAADYEALLKENSLLKEQLQALEERTRGLEEREKVLQETLVTTQRLVEEMKDQARREATVIIREAEVQADRIIEVSRAAEGNLQSEIIALKRTRRQLTEGLRSTVEMYQRLLEQDLKAAAGDEPEKS